MFPCLMNYTMCLSVKYSRLWNRREGANKRGTEKQLEVNKRGVTISGGENEM